MPCTPHGKGITVGRVQNAVDILLGGDGIAGMKVLRDPHSLIGSDLIGEMDVQGAWNTIHGDGSLHVILSAESDCSAKHEGVDTAIGTGAARNVAGAAKKGGSAFSERLLNGIAVFLGLIAAEGSVGGASAIVTDVQQYLAGLAIHNRPPLHRFLLIQYITNSEKSQGRP